jgi:glyoxylase-like metal-dependent hydrolase (beta-lactamase superfamily II)
MKKIILFSMLLISFFSCKNSDKNDAVKSQKLNVKLHVFDGGEIIANKLDLFSEDTTYQGQSKVLADPYYLIIHPKGKLIWDGGLPENLVGLPEPFTDPNGAFTVSRKDSVKNQLKSIGLEINDIDFIALSHSHFDHIGHANSFSNSTWLVQENEYDFFTNDSAKVNQADIYNLIKDLKKVKKLSGDHDVFGDGTVIIKSMPGHTIGHQVLYLDIGLEQPILLTGDLYHFEENRTNQIAPIFNFNIPQTKKSMKVFEDFAKENNANVFIQHSPSDFERLKALINN